MYMCMLVCLSVLCLSSDRHTNLIEEEETKNECVPLHRRQHARRKHLPLMKTPRFIVHQRTDRWWGRGYRVWGLGRGELVLSPTVPMLISFAYEWKAGLHDWENC